MSKSMFLLEIKIKKKMRRVVRIYSMYIYTLWWEREKKRGMECHADKIEKQRERGKNRRWGVYRGGGEGAHWGREEKDREWSGKQRVCGASVGVACAGAAENQGGGGGFVQVVKVPFYQDTRPKTRITLIISSMQ